MSGFITTQTTTYGVFTDAEKIDILRFCGYPAYGSDGTYDPFGLYFPTYQQPTAVIPARMNAVLTVARTKLTEIQALDAAIVSAADRLSTASAAVWIRNKDEVRDRTSLLRQRCRDLCVVLGVPPGPGLSGGNSLRLVV